MCSVIVIILLFRFRFFTILLIHNTITSFYLYILIVFESFLSGILNANNQTKKFFATKLSRFSYLLMLLLLGGDIEICPGLQNTLSDFCKNRGFKIVHQNVRGILSNHHLLVSFVNKTRVKNCCDLRIKTHIKEGDICDICILYLVIYIYNEIEMLVPLEVFVLMNNFKTRNKIQTQI